MPTIVPFETLTELFLNLSKKYRGSGKTAFARKPSHEAPYETITWDEVSSDVYALAAYLVEHNIEPGDRVGLLSENRYEWAIVDLALQLIGAVNVSIYATLPADQCAYILKNAEAKLFFVSTGIQLKKARQLFDKSSTLKKIIAFETPNVENYLDANHVQLFDNVMQAGRQQLQQHNKEIEQRAANIDPHDTATLIYTSGTTGAPKGAMLSHHNIVSNIKSAHQHLHVHDNDRCLSFLPLCHSFERTAGYYAMIAAGTEIYYAESIDTVAKNMIEAKPTLLLSVPRLFEKIYGLITKKAEEGSAIKKTIFEQAMKIGRKYADGQRGYIVPLKKIADKLVFDKLKERTGGRIRFFVSGGAPLSAEIGKFFKAAGLNIIEGYGLTETSPIISADRHGEEQVGTVGSVLRGLTVGIQRLSDNKIICEVSGESYPNDVTSEEGEILCKGPNVMKGYWKNDEATDEMIDSQGWLHTGDVGRFVDGNLQITDRIKHMIVNAGGKNIYPGPIEEKFKTNKWIDQVMIVGEQQPFMAALIVPNFDELETFAKNQNVSYNSLEQLVHQPEIQKLYKKEVRSYAQEMASHDKIRDFRLIPDEFTIESGELTPTLKIKRRVVVDKYSGLIKEMFNDR